MGSRQLVLGVFPDCQLAIESMKPETRKYIQVLLAVALIAAAVRLVLIFRERR